MDLGNAASEVDEGVIAGHSSSIPRAARHVKQVLDRDLEADAVEIPDARHTASRLGWSAATRKSHLEKPYDPSGNDRAGASDMRHVSRGLGATSSWTREQLLRRYPLAPAQT